MRRATQVVQAGQWQPEEAAATATLDFDSRYRRRLVLADDNGAPFLLDLDAVAVLRDGDGLALDGGGVIRVIAAAEAVADVGGADPRTMLRLAWHLGNRHAEVEILAGGTLRLRDDPVLVAMLEGLGAQVTRVRAPFQPEPGAYAPDHGHGH